MYFTSNLHKGIIRSTEVTTLPDKELVYNIIEHKIHALQASKLICENLIEQTVERGIPLKFSDFLGLL